MKKRSELISELNRVQKYYIQNHSTKDPKLLAKDCGVRVTCVRAYLSFLSEKRDKQKHEEILRQKKELEDAKKSQPITTHVVADSLMVKKRGSLVMTPEASELGDAAPRRRMSDKLAKNTQKIRPE